MSMDLSAVSAVEEAAAEAAAEETACWQHSLPASQSHSKSQGQRRLRECFMLASSGASAAAKSSTSTTLSALNGTW